MAVNWRRGAVFGAGLLAGAVAVGAMFGLRSPPERASSAQGTPAAAAVELAAMPEPQPDCSFRPVVSSAGEGDGKVALEKVESGSASHVAALILAGKEAAAAGRPRDAETSFLQACRTAEAMQDGDRMLVADAMYQLGRHYGSVVVQGAAGSRRDELLRRAGGLYAASLQAYRQRHGENHEKTRFAAQGLAMVQQHAGGRLQAAAPGPAKAAARDGATEVAQAPQSTKAQSTKAQSTKAQAAKAQATTAQATMVPPSTPAAEPAPAAAAVMPAPAPAQAVAVAPAPVRPTPAEPAVAARSLPSTTVAAPPPRPTAQPSFDCAKARSTTEKLICGDAELARMDRELGGLHQRARQAAADPRAFQRESDAHWQRREDTCRDRECLRQWFAMRREQLASAPARAAPAPRPAPVQRAAAAERAEPAERAGASERAGAAERAAAGERSAQAERALPVARPVPVERPEPMERTAPIARAPAVETAPRIPPVPMDAAPVGTATGSAGEPD